MDLERARAMMLALPHVVETMQWGDNLVFWVGDKAIGGKMFALANLDARSELVVAFAAGQERAAELCEVEGFCPAPYFGRLGWVAAERWDLLPASEWQKHFAFACELTLNKLSPRTRASLALPAKELRALVVERRRILAAKAKEKGRGGEKHRRPISGA